MNAILTTYESKFELREVSAESFNISGHDGPMTQNATLQAVSAGFCVAICNRHVANGDRRRTPSIFNTPRFHSRARRTRSWALTEAVEDAGHRRQPVIARWNHAAYRRPAPLGRKSGGATGFQAPPVSSQSRVSGRRNRGKPRNVPANRRFKKSFQKCPHRRLPFVLGVRFNHVQHTEKS